jgi:hypothetical protein
MRIRFFSEEDEEEEEEEEEGRGGGSPVTIGLSREPLLKGKTQYGWPPHYHCFFVKM